MMNWLKALVKKFKWAFWALIGVLSLAGMWFARTLFTADPKNPTGLPEVPDKLKEKVAKAEEDALIARIEAKVGAEKAKDILDAAATVNDGKERRKKLAEALKKL